MAGLDEETIDDILYLARANEAVELEAYLSGLSEKTKQSRAELLTKAVDPYSKNSALHYAAANGHIDIIKLLFAPGTEKPAPAFINAINGAGNTSLHWAALNGHLESVKVLVEAGADVTVINKAGHDAVFEAEINDKGDVVDWLLGAVEELETGIGQTGEGSAGDEDMEDAGSDDATDKDAAAQDVTSAGSSIEGVRKQMEDMSTKQDTSKHG
ncbi:ankyrin [Plenodomus tracheiphilus IPT5]|uniref:Ankyrin n=1 Tax=Plenodomus tracheiphilus IPT5 TaxID=1408161 RepID=A0A6A7B9I8_9PLEO|nr:ankyrin [Plenodomus tracheiphilus IPT5]